MAGNRRFGIYSDSNHPGEFDFYTMGVDRLTDWEMDLAQKQPLEMLQPLYNADKLWKSFQTGIYNFLDTHSGASTIQTPVIYRPNWPDVWDVIIGKKPLRTLSKLCP